MQLILVFSIIIAIGAVMFALQNNVPVTVSVAIWSFDSSLAMVLLLALGLGVVSAALLSSPTAVRGQWAVSRLCRQRAVLEKEKVTLEQRFSELQQSLPRPPSSAAQALNALATFAPFTCVVPL